VSALTTTGSGRALARKRLREAITRGDLAPGHRLIEADVVEQYGVTRSGVRLALDDLAAEGLVERVPNRGARVRTVSRDEAIAITECRMVLEALLARKAAERITDEEIAELRAQAGLLAEAVADGELVRYSALIQQLYAQVHAAARQPVAAALIDRLQAQIVRHQFQLSLRPGRPRTSLRELTELVEAIADRRPDRAAAAATAHLESVIAALADTYDATPVSTSSAS
jgi:DNA-binding GntR family transcriptional regulator